MYYEALRNYVLDIKDAHTVLVPNPDDQDAVDFVSHQVKFHTAGSYGLVLSKTNERHVQNNHYLVIYVDPNSSAAQVGIKVGAEILKWIGKPIVQSVSETSILWSDENACGLSALPFSAYMAGTQASV